MAVGILLGQKLVTDLAIPKSPASASMLWVYLWAAAAAIHSMTGIVLWVSSRPSAIVHIPSPDAVISDANIDQSLPTFGELIQYAFAREAWPAMGLIAALYTLGFLVTYTWPVLLSDHDAGFEYFTPTSLFVCGAIGSIIALVRTFGCQTDLPAPGQTRLAARGASGAAALILLATFLILRVAKAGQDVSPAVKCVAIGVISLSRVPQFFADPFVMSLIHRAISRDDVRAAVVSLRTAITSLGTAVASALLFWCNWGSTTLSSSVAFVLLIVAIVVLLALAILWWKVELRPHFLRNGQRIHKWLPFVSKADAKQ